MPTDDLDEQWTSTAGQPVEPPAPQSRAAGGALQHARTGMSMLSAAAERMRQPEALDEAARRELADDVDCAVALLSGLQELVVKEEQRALARPAPQSAGGGRARARCARGRARSSTLGAESRARGRAATCRHSTARGNAGPAKVGGMGATRGGQRPRPRRRTAHAVPARRGSAQDARAHGRGGRAARGGQTTPHQARSRNAPTGGRHGAATAGAT